MLEPAIFRAERKAKAIDLLGGVCVKCGSVEKLEFDHINKDRQDAQHNISNLICYRWSKVLAELEKCQLLCKKCHTEKSVLEMGLTIGPVHGKRWTYDHYKCRCDKCKKVASTRLKAYYKRHKQR